MPLYRKAPERFAEREGKKKMLRKSTLLKLIVFILLALFGYAFWIEPRSLVIRSVTIPLAGLKEPVKAVLIGDLQPMNPYWPPDRMQWAMAQAQAQKPDIVFFVGDYAYEPTPGTRHSSESLTGYFPSSSPIGGSDIGWAYARRASLHPRDWAAYCADTLQKIRLWVVQGGGTAALCDGRYRHRHPASAIPDSAGNRGTEPDPYLTSVLMT
jgi:hypothetical protein